LGRGLHRWRRLRIAIQDQLQQALFGSLVTAQGDGSRGLRRPFHLAGLRGGVGAGEPERARGIVDLPLREAVTRVVHLDGQLIRPRFPRRLDRDLRRALDGLQVGFGPRRDGLRLRAPQFKELGRRFGVRGDDPFEPVLAVE